MPASTAKPTKMKTMQKTSSLSEGAPAVQHGSQMKSLQFGQDRTNFKTTLPSIVSKPEKTATTGTGGSKSTTKKGKKEALKETVLKVQKEVATLAPTLELNSAITTTRLMEKLQRQQSSQKILKHPTQCKIDLAFHYTRKQNIELIKANGLMTMQERKRNNVKSASNQGKMYNDGIYTGNNPFSFCFYGDTGIVLARLCGELHGSIERVHYKDQIDKDFKSVIIGNKYKPFDHKQLFDEVVLQFGSQVVPLMTYSCSAVNPLVKSNQKNVHILYKACDMLLESINSHWNTKSMGQATIIKYSIEDFLTESVKFNHYWSLRASQAQANASCFQMPGGKPPPARASASSLSRAGGTASSSLSGASASFATASSAAARARAAARPVRKSHILPASKATKNATKKLPPSASIGPKSKTTSATNMRSNQKNSTKLSSGHGDSCSKSFEPVKEAVSKSFEFMKRLVLCCCSSRPKHPRKTKV